MYREAGVPLATVHLGGDEVARGVWLGSPKCQALMKEKGMTKPHDLAEHFITQMADIMQRNGLKFSGWQEVALGHTEEAHRQLRTQAAGVYCWNTVPGYDEVVYQIANNGYPVILCNVGNFYMDMAYNGHPDERGQFRRFGCSGKGKNSSDGRGAKEYPGCARSVVCRNNP